MSKDGFYLFGHSTPICPECGACLTYSADSKSIGETVWKHYSYSEGEYECSRAGKYYREPLVELEEVKAGQE